MSAAVAPIDQTSLILRAGFSDLSKSAPGQTEKSRRATGKSALPSSTDIVSTACQVRNVPTADTASAY